MKQTPLSVMDKKLTPPSGDKHDYMSLAPYFWPNPETKDHLPYVRHDGQHNPETALISDHVEFTKMAEGVKWLAMAYYQTGDAAYAKQASVDLHVWFLNPATRMNPNLKYAQAVKGVNDGRGTGILESRCLTDVVDGLALLQGAGEWSASDEAGMRAWIEAYFTWLTTSKNGQDEHNAKNNHGSWNDVQQSALAMYLGKTDFAKDMVETAKTKRVALQIEPDGQQPMEEARTKSFGYSVFNVTALMNLATIGDRVNVDLWDYTAPSGASVRIALDYLLKFANDPKGWGHENIEGMDANSLRRPLLMAAIHYHDVKYEKAAMKMQSKNDPEQRLLELVLKMSDTANAKGR
jgi:hypothetical protein